MTDTQAFRCQLRAAGYDPLPLFGKAPPQYGKHGRKGLTRWQTLHEVSTDDITMWSRQWPDAVNTGVLTRTMPTLDGDLLEEEAARACIDFVRDRYEDRGYVLIRTDKAPKFAIPFRTEEPFKKIIVTLIAPNGTGEQKIEFLADGEQVVVSGIHPDTGKPYRWHGGEPGEIALADLPYIREAEARTLVDDLVALLIREFGYKRAPGRPRSPRVNGQGATGGGESDWTYLFANIHEGRELHDSLRDLAAKMICAGTNPGGVINQLNALMQGSKAPKDKRWLARKSEIPAAVDSAVAKYGKPGTRSSVEPQAEPTRPAAKTPATESPRLRATHNVFRKWLGDAYDIDVLNAVLAAAASERLTGDPLWLLVISGPGNAKTETVQALAGAGATTTSTIASEGALLSATSRKQKSKHATGGLRRKLGDRGILVIKDVTSILSADRNTRGPVLGAIREIYDGRWDRNVGSDGGLTLTWTGRLVIIGAVTTAWDAAHGVIATMGDRFVIIRADSSSGRATSATKAIGNTGSETDMRRELAQVTGALINHIDRSGYVLNKTESAELIKAADIVTAARTGVERDYRGDVINAHALEMPTRYAKQLGQLVRGAVAIGMPVENAMRLAIRCARDSIPPLRCEILLDIAAHSNSEPHEVHRRIGRPRHTVRRELEALHMLRLLQCEETDDKNEKGKVVRTIYLQPGRRVRPRDAAGDDRAAKAAGGQGRLTRVGGERGSSKDLESRVRKSE
jgi:Bifunctional DNA primase/polymerase, N-terminal